MSREIKRKKNQIADIESTLLAIVRQSAGISRLSLSKELKVAASTVGTYVERLKSEGYLLETKKEKTLKSGRPEVLLRLNPQRGEFIGVDFYAEHILAESLDFANRQVKQEIVRISQDDSEKTVLQKLLTVIKNCWFIYKPWRASARVCYTPSLKCAIQKGKKAISEK